MMRLKTYEEMFPKLKKKDIGKCYTRTICLAGIPTREYVHRQFEEFSYRVQIARKNGRYAPCHCGNDKDFIRTHLSAGWYAIVSVPNTKPFVLCRDCDDLEHVQHVVYDWLVSQFRESGLFVEEVPDALQNV